MWRRRIPNQVGFTLREMGNEVARAVEKLRANGDENVHFIDGLKVFGSEYAHLLPDDVHPDNEGCAVMAKNLLRLLPNV